MKFEKETDGVLLLCSKKGLKKYFSDKEFNYDFPEGILPLINSGIALAIITESGEEVTGELRIMGGMNDKSDYEIASENKFYIEDNDEIFILSHSEFTQVCSNNNGDLDTFEFWNEKITKSDLTAGWCFAFTYFKTSEEPPYLDIIFQLTHSKIQPPYEDLSKISAI
jgi:hypothetical protein